MYLFFWLGYFFCFEIIIKKDPDGRGVIVIKLPVLYAEQESGQECSRHQNADTDQNE